MSPPLHLVRGESKTEVRSRPWLQDQISTDTVLHSHHNATNWTSCLNTWQREQKSRNLSWQGWLCYAAESDVRGEISVFMLESDSHCIFPIVILRNTMLPDCGWHDEKKTLTRRCHDALLETKTGTRISMTRTTCNRLNIRQRIQITLPTLLTQGWSSPRCGFWCQRWDVGLHVRFRFPLCLSFRHFSRHQLSKHFTLLKTRNIFHVAATPPGTKRIKNRGEFSTLIPESDSHWHLPILISQCNHLHILLGHLAERTKIQKPLLTRLSLPRWRVRCQRRDVCLHTEVRFPLYLSCHHVLQHKMLRRKTARQNPTNLSCRCQSVWYGMNWKTDVRSRSRLQNQISIDTFLSSHHNATNWTPGLNTWHRQQKHRTNSTDRRFILATLRSQMSEVRCLSSCRSQIPTVSFPSSFSVTPCYQTVVDTMKKKTLTRRCHDALLETKTGARISVTRTTCNRLNIWQRIQITLPTLLTHSWSLPRCGFGCQRWDVCLHVRFRFPLCLSFRHFSRHQLSKHFTLFKTRGIFHVAATPPGTKRIKNRGEFSTLIPESDFHWHLPTLTSQCNHLHILLGHLAERTKIQKPLLTRMSLPRWRVGCQSWDVCLHVEVRFPLYLSYRHSPQQQLVSC